MTNVAAMRSWAALAEQSDTLKPQLQEIQCNLQEAQGGLSETRSSGTGLPPGHALTSRSGR
jgi:hypothetical protein